MRKANASEIREFAIEHYIEPARQAGQPQVTIRAGDVRKKMGVSTDRTAAVAGALGTDLFLEEARVVRVSRDGPAAGASATFCFRVLP
jgi:5-methylcytosine-specific restriction protein B